MLTGITTVNPATGIRTTVRIPAEGTHRHIAVHRRYVPCGPWKDGRRPVKPADWFLSWGFRTRCGTGYSYEGMEKERGFKTKREAVARKRELLKELGW